MKKLLFAALLTFKAMASTEPLPPIGNKIFVDFKEANYEINIDFKTKKVTTASTIDLYQDQDGHIVFDLKKPLLKVEVDGMPSKADSFIISSSLGIAKKVKRFTTKGFHTLKVVTELKNGINFKNGFELGFFMRDLYGRKFLEQYLPTNFEYDQYKAKIKFNFLNISQDEFRNYVLMTNGEQKTNGTSIEVSYPEFYTASSFFIHLFKKDKYIIVKDIYTTLDGRNIDFYTYSREEDLTKSLHEKAVTTLRNLEDLFGEWPHDYLVIFGDQKSGGMEHAGATQTSLGSLSHELMHSYFSKSVIPSNGNAGWMDEAIVTWVDHGSLLEKDIKGLKVNLACHSVYKRATDWRSYKKGSRVISHIAYLFHEQGISFHDVLKYYHSTYKHTVVTTKHFQHFIESQLGQSLDAIFNKYVYGKKGCYR